MSVTPSRSSHRFYQSDPRRNNSIFFTPGTYSRRSGDRLHPHDAKTLALSLMARHGLAGWSFRFDHARRRFGSCRYRSRLITLSRPLTLLNDEHQVCDTILHEIAHALAPDDGHGARWKSKCVEIGANPTRCFDDETVRSPVRPPARYCLGCRRCNWWIDRRRLSRTRYICRRCREPLVFQEKTLVGTELSK